MTNKSELLESSNNKSRSRATQSYSSSPPLSPRSQRKHSQQRTCSMINNNNIMCSTPSSSFSSSPTLRDAVVASLRETRSAVLETRKSKAHAERQRPKHQIPPSIEQMLLQERDGRGEESALKSSTESTTSKNEQETNELSANKLPLREKSQRSKKSHKNKKAFSSSSMIYSSFHASLPDLPPLSQEGRKQLLNSSSTTTSMLNKSVNDFRRFPNLDGTSGDVTEHDDIDNTSLHFDDDDTAFFDFHQSQREEAAAQKSRRSFQLAREASIDELISQTRCFTTKEEQEELQKSTSFCHQHHPSGSTSSLLFEPLKDTLDILNDADQLIQDTANDSANSLLRYDDVSVYHNVPSISVRTEKTDLAEYDAPGSREFYDPALLSAVLEQAAAQTDDDDEEDTDEEDNQSKLGSIDSSKNSVRMVHFAPSLSVAQASQKESPAVGGDDSVEMEALAAVPPTGLKRVESAGILKKSSFGQDLFAPPPPLTPTSTKKMTGAFLTPTLSRHQSHEASSALMHCKPPSLSRHRSVPTVTDTEIAAIAQELKSETDEKKMKKKKRTTMLSKTAKNINKVDTAATAVPASPKSPSTSSSVKSSRLLGKNKYATTGCGDGSLSSPSYSKRSITNSPSSSRRTTHSAASGSRLMISLSLSPKFPDLLSDNVCDSKEGRRQLVERNLTAALSSIDHFDVISNEMSRMTQVALPIGLPFASDDVDIADLMVTDADKLPSRRSPSPPLLKRASGVRSSRRSGSPSKHSLEQRNGSPSKRTERSGSPSKRTERSGSPSKCTERSDSPSKRTERSGSPSKRTERNGSPPKHAEHSGSPSKSRHHRHHTNRASSSSPSRASAADPGDGAILLAPTSAPDVIVESLRHSSPRRNSRKKTGTVSSSSSQQQPKTTTNTRDQILSEHMARQVVREGLQRISVRP